MINVFPCHYVRNAFIFGNFLLFSLRPFTNIMPGSSAWIAGPLASISVRAQLNQPTVLAGSANGVPFYPPRSPQDHLTIVLFPNTFCRNVISAMPIPINGETLCMCIFEQAEVFCQAVNLQKMTPIQLTLPVSIIPCLFILREEISTIADFDPGRS